MVPNRLEYAVGEPDDHQILNGFLPQIMIDAEDLRFVEYTSRHAVDGLGRGQIAADRFLDDDAGVGRMSLRLRRQSGLFKPLAHRRNRTGRDAQIENPVAG